MVGPHSSKEHAALRRVLPFLCAVAAVAAGPVADAAAAAPRAVFAVQALQTRASHGYFILDARPGETIRRSVRIVNTGGRAGTVRLNAVDATTGQTTGAVYLDRQAPRRGVGGWITLSTGEVRLARGQSRTVALTIRVPRQVRDGQHLGGVVAENTQLTRGPARKRGRSSLRVDVRTQTIVAVQVNLPGTPRERMVLTSVRPGGTAGRQKLFVGLRNEGNRLVKGRGDMVVTDARGARLRHARFNVDTFVPSTAVADPIAVPRRALPAGKYRADVTLHYGDGHVARLSAPFSISRKQLAQVFGSQPQQSPLVAGSGTPLLAIVLGAIALLAVGFLAAFLYLRRRLAGHAAALPPDRQPRP